MVSKKMIVTSMLIAIVSLAFAGCSDDNPVTTDIPVDTAPLPVPTNPSVEYSKGKAVLEWSPIFDSRVIGYVVTREQNGETGNMGSFPVPTTRFVDTTPLNGTSQYYIQSTDNAGRLSGAATVRLTINLFSPPVRMSK